MSISLVTIAAGEAYAPFIAPWREAVLAMERKPDEIIIVIGEQDDAQVEQYDWSEIPTFILTLFEPFSTAYFNAAVCAAKSEWVSYCGIDDLMLPKAYMDLDEDADIIVGTVLLDNDREWVGVWDTEIMQHLNPLPAHSLFRKDLWVRVGGYPNIRWSDWGFWLRCAKANPRIAKGKHPVASFDTGQGRETMSGASLDLGIRARANMELELFKASL